MRLIDADALINDILTDYGCDPKYIADETIDGLKPYTDNLILERIGLQPTIDAVPVVHGYNLREDTPSLFECSICGWSCNDTYYGDTDTYNYCPNCGARMDGKEKTDADS